MDLSGKVFEITEGGSSARWLTGHLSTGIKWWLEDTGGKLPQNKINLGARKGWLLMCPEGDSRHCFPDESRSWVIYSYFSGGTWHRASEERTMPRCTNGTLRIIYCSSSRTFTTRKSFSNSQQPLLREVVATVQLCPSKTHHQAHTCSGYLKSLLTGLLHPSSSFCFCLFTTLQS
jgi:hypothetical protein